MAAEYFMLGINIKSSAEAALSWLIETKLPVMHHIKVDETGNTGTRGNIVQSLLAEWRVIHFLFSSF
jgi:hypothetical protein